MEAIKCSRADTHAGNCVCRGHGELIVIETDLKTCPVCHGALIPIVYGMPGPELFEEAEAGDAELGGCQIFVPDEAPQMRCSACGRGFVLIAQMAAARAFYESAPGAH